MTNSSPKREPRGESDRESHGDRASDGDSLFGSILRLLPGFVPGAPRRNVLVGLLYVYLLLLGIELFERSGELITTALPIAT
jgi:hypothetical protein